MKPVARFTVVYKPSKNFYELNQTSYDKVVWSEIVFTPNILGFLVCLIGIGAAQIYTGRSDYYQNLKDWLSRLKAKPIDEIIEMIFLKALNIILFLVLYITGGYTIARLIGMCSSLDIFKYLKDSFVYLNNLNKDPAINAQQRKIIKAAFYVDFWSELEKRFQKFRKFFVSYWVRRSIFCAITHIPSWIQFLASYFSFFEIFLATAEFTESSFLIPGFILALLSFLVGINFEKFSNLRTLLNFIIFGILRNVRPYLLYYISKILGFILWIPYKKQEFQEFDTKLLLESVKESWTINLPKFDEYDEKIQTCRLKFQTLRL